MKPKTRGKKPVHRQMKDFVMEVLYGIRRFFIIGSGGYTRYSDHYKFEEKVAEELRKLRNRRRGGLNESKRGI